MLNIQGQVIGINTAAISASTQGGFSGVGLAIPSTTVLRIVPTLIEKNLRDDSPKSKSTNADDSSGSTGDTSGISAKDLKSLSKCQSGAAEDGDLTQAEVTDCYSQVF